MEISGKNATVAFGSIKNDLKIDRLERANHTPKTEGIAKSTFVSSQTHDQMYERSLASNRTLMYAECVEMKPYRQSPILLMMPY